MSFETLTFPANVTMDVSANTTSGETLTFATSPIAAGVVAGMVVIDSTHPNAIAPGTTVSSTTSTTVVLSQAVASEVFSADAIEFMPVTVLKSSAGTLQSITVTGAAAGSSVTAYDATSAAGTPTVIDPNSNSYTNNSTVTFADGLSSNVGPTPFQAAVNGLLGMRLNYGQRTADGIVLVTSGQIQLVAEWQ